MLPSLCTRHSAWSTELTLVLLPGAGGFHSNWTNAVTGKALQGQGERGPWEAESLAVPALERELVFCKTSWEVLFPDFLLLP